MVFIDLMDWEFFQNKFTYSMILYSVISRGEWVAAWIEMHWILVIKRLAFPHRLTNSQLNAIGDEWGSGVFFLYCNQTPIIALYLFICVGGMCNQIIQLSMTNCTAHVITAIIWITDGSIYMKTLKFQIEKWKREQWIFLFDYHRIKYQWLW